MRTLTLFVRKENEMERAAVALVNSAPPPPAYKPLMGPDLDRMREGELRAVAMLERTKEEIQSEIDRLGFELSYTDTALAARRASLALLPMEGPQ